MEKKKLYNLELLRIGSMLLIIMLHMMGHGELLEKASKETNRYAFLWTLEAFSFVAVNCYVLLSGYFMIASTFKLKRLIKIMIETFFYSTVLFVVTYLVGLQDNPFSVQYLMPILSRQYWFVTMYFGLFVLSPFLNKFLLSLSKIQHFTFNVILVMLFSVWPTFFHFTTTLDFGNGMGVVWFICLYSFASYLRLYYHPSYKGRWRFVLIYILGSFLIAQSKFWIESVEAWKWRELVMYNNNSILVLMTSIAVFFFFLNIKIENKTLSKVICFFSANTLGVYLIHDNNSVRMSLWSFIYPVQYLWTPLYWAKLGFFVVAIYLIAMTIDKLREKLFEPLINSAFFDRLCQTLQDKIILSIHILANKLG